MALEKPVKFGNFFLLLCGHLVILASLQCDKCICDRKARRCYQKAFELDRQSPEAGSGLVQVLMKLDEKVLKLMSFSVVMLISGLYRDVLKV